MRPRIRSEGLFPAISPDHIRCRRGNRARAARGRKLCTLPVYARSSERPGFPDQPLVRRSANSGSALNGHLTPVDIPMIAVAKEALQQAIDAGGSAYKARCLGLTPYLRDA